MMSERATIRELKAYWEYVRTLNEGDVIEKYITNERMPLWDDICYGLDWRVYPFDGGSFSKKHHGFCGVYRVFGIAEESKANTPAHISRVCGEDTNGTLYIGRSGWLSDRLNQFRRSLESEKTHLAAVAWRNCETLKRRFPLGRLGVGLLFTDVDAEAMVEFDLMRAYLNTFGDTPPLNYSF